MAIEHKHSEPLKPTRKDKVKLAVILVILVIILAGVLVGIGF